MWLAIKKTTRQPYSRVLATSAYLLTRPLAGARMRFNKVDRKVERRWEVFAHTRQRLL